MITKRRPPENIADTIAEYLIVNYESIEDPLKEGLWLVKPASRSSNLLDRPFHRIYEGTLIDTLATIITNKCFFNFYTDNVTYPGNATIQEISTSQTLPPIGNLLSLSFDGKTTILVPPSSQYDEVRNLYTKDGFINQVRSINDTRNYQVTDDKIVFQKPEKTVPLEKIADWLYS